MTSMSGAKIKYVQEGNVGATGVALIGVVTTPVTASNGLILPGETLRHRWTWVDVPTGSSLVTGMIVDGTMSSITFVPDVAGDYLLRLECFDVNSFRTIDERVFRVLNSDGLPLPAFGASDEALNFDGQTRGWKPDMEAWFNKILSSGGGISTFTVGPSGSGATYITDGVNDEVQFQQAIDAASAAGGGIVRLLNGTYTLYAKVDGKNKVVIEGNGRATLIQLHSSFSNTNAYAIGAAGSLTTGASIPLASNATFGATTIVATAGAEYTAIAAGDWLFLISDAVWETQNTSLREVGEYVRVASKASPNLTLYGMIRDAYNTADSARLYRVTFVEGFGLRNLAIKQAPALDTRAGNVPPLVSFQVCRNCFIENCELYENDGPGVTDYHSISTRIEGNFIHDLTDNVAQSRLGYGCLVGGASENTVVRGNRFDRMRHAIDAGPSIAAAGFSAVTNNGIPRGVNVVGNVCLRCANTAISTHNEAAGWTIASNTVENCESTGIAMRGRGCSILSNTVSWCSGGILVGNAGAFGTSSGSAAGTKVIGNSVQHIKNITPGSTGTNFGGYGIILAVTDNSVVQDNVVSSCDAAGIRLRQYVRRNTIRGNTILNANLANTSNVPAIEMESEPRSTAVSLTFSGGTITATGFTSLTNVAVGRTVVVTGAATAANNGTFTVLSQSGGNTLTWANASGATDANNGSIVAYVESTTDNVIEGNTAVNTAASDFEKDATGHAKYFCFASGTSGNGRNKFHKNTAIGMETGFISSTHTYEAIDNVVGDGIVQSGNEKLDTRQYTIRPVTTPNATPVTVLTLATTTNRNYWVTGYVQATNGGGGYWTYTIRAMWQNSGGVLTLRLPAGASAAVTPDIESSASADVTANLSGTTVPIQVQGISGNVTWSGLIFVSEARL